MLGVWSSGDGKLGACSSENRIGDWSPEERERRVLPFGVKGIGAWSSGDGRKGARLRLGTDLDSDFLLVRLRTGKTEVHL